MWGRSSKASKIVGDTGTVIIGSVLFSMAMNMFLLPSNTVLGGMTGIATVLNMIFGTPVGLMIILLNIPLLMANTYFLGSGFLKKTVIGIAATSVAVDIFSFFPIPRIDPLICAILGGVCMGAGTGTLISRGFTTGGTDLIACLVRMKWKNVTTGTVIIVSDLVIIFGASLFTGSIDGLFYSVVCTWTSGKVMDMIISGTVRAGQAFVVTNRPDELKNAIYQKLDRGVTVISAVGGYTGETRSIIMCALSKREIYKFKQLATECDPGSFIIISEAFFVSGNGFMGQQIGSGVSKKHENR